MTAGGRWISTGPVLTHSRENIFKVIFNLRFFKSKFLFENSYNLNCICVLLNIGYQVQIFTEGKKRSCHYIAETAFCWCSCSLLCLRSLIHEKISFGIEIARERKIEMPGQRGNGRVRYEVRVVKINVSGGLPDGPINEPINASSAIIDLQHLLCYWAEWETLLFLWQLALSSSPARKHPAVINLAALLVILNCVHTSLVKHCNNIIS